MPRSTAVTAMSAAAACGEEDGRRVRAGENRRAAKPPRDEGSPRAEPHGHLRGACDNAPMPTREQVLEALKAVIDPELRRDIVELEMVRSIDIKDGGAVDVTVSLTTPGCPIKNHFQVAVADAVKSVAGVAAVNVGFDVLTDQEKAGLQRKLGRPGGLPEGSLAEVSTVICIGSGKGGVGKSSLTVNLAAALAADGKRVGVLDADVWGYSIPRMLGLGNERPKVSAERKILPLEAHGLKVMSIGFFLGEDEAVVWRGPMLHKALTQFLEDVAWGALDFLLIDLPPGTGDVSMTLSQLLPQAKFVIVTTPQPTAQKVARRAAEMADKVKLEIAGVIENMSGFTTPSGERYALFGEGGGQALADEIEVPLLGTVPLTMPLREQSDAGVPLMLVDPDDPASQAVRQAARGIIALSPIALPIMQVRAPAPPPQPVGMTLPMVS
jgi:ATP-binding protein involved in chromosome partitioning